MLTRLPTAPGNSPAVRKNRDRREQREGNCDAHLAAIRKCTCVVTLQTPAGEAHHLKHGTGERGAGIRSTDRWALPLSRWAHDELERLGSRREPKWFQDRGIDDPLGLAAALWAASPNVAQMTRIIIEHRKPRQAAPRDVDSNPEQPKGRHEMNDNPPAVANVSEMPMSSAPNPTKPPPDVEALAVKWSPIKRQAFAAMEPAAIALVATDGPVSVTLYDAKGAPVRRFGHNRGVWPAKIACANAWRDSVSNAYDKNPFFFVGVQFRVWVQDRDDRDRLAEAVVAAIAKRAERDGGFDELMHGFLDLSAELDLFLLEMETHAIAQDLGMRCWDDDGLSKFLDGVVGRAESLMKSGRSPSPDVLRRALGDVQ